VRASGRARERESNAHSHRPPGGQEWAFSSGPMDSQAGRRGADDPIGARIARFARADSV